MSQVIYGTVRYIRYRSWIQKKDNLYKFLMMLCQHSFKADGYLLQMSQVILFYTSLPRSTPVHVWLQRRRTKRTQGKQPSRRCSKASKDLAADRWPLISLEFVDSLASNPAFFLGYFWFIWCESVRSLNLCALVKCCVPYGSLMWCDVMTGQILYPVASACLLT